MQMQSDSTPMESEIHAVRFHLVVSASSASSCSLNDLFYGSRPKKPIATGYGSIIPEREIIASSPMMVMGDAKRLSKHLAVLLPALSSLFGVTLSIGLSLEMHQVQ